jgi:hypothetical protein
MEETFTGKWGTAILGLGLTVIVVAVGWAVAFS